MKTLVIYDSFFGNTEKIARAIGAAALASQGETQVVKVADVKSEHLEGVTALFVGSPTRAFRPTEPVVMFLKNLPEGALQGMRTAAFDTRVAPEDIKAGALRFIVKFAGYAAKPIADLLVKKGGMLAQPPEGFFVLASEGPLKDGEEERAGAWAKACLGA